MLDFASLREKLNERSQRIVSIAIEESKRRNHYYLGVEHLFVSFIEVEKEFFDETVRNIGIDPNTVKYTVLQNLKPSKQYVGKSIKITQEVFRFFEIALEHSRFAGKSKIDPSDLFIAFFEVKSSLPARILANYGVRPEEIIQEINTQSKRRRIFEQEISKNYELPPYLKQYGTNLNFLVRMDKIPPIIGREEEIKQLVEILCHKDRSNSVMLVGEPGVGKTAIAEGLARLIELYTDSVPVRLRDRQIVQLDLNSIVSGTMFRGMFEERMEKIMKELRGAKKYILFIDEAHTLIGTGSAMGVPADAANILKSALSRGEIQIIGSTTYQEYRMYIAQDEALARRFRVVYVKEPSVTELKDIIKGLQTHFEETYSVTIQEESIDKLIELSERYNRSIREPAKSISWLDTACVKAEIYDKEKIVRPSYIEEVAAQDSKIPVNIVRRKSEELFFDLRQRLEERIVGQKDAIEAVVRTIRTKAGPLKENFDKPSGVFLFLGPTGVGKTELAKALAYALFNDDKRMVRVDMSEYSDSSLGVEKLIGMPRGIVGSEVGGVLTNQVKENPFTVVLLDEFEKAHPLVRNLFLQVFDDGCLTDGRGKRVYFSDSIIILTSNIGSEIYRSITNPLGFLKENVDSSRVTKNILNLAEKSFPPEFLNRMDEIVIFRPLTKEEVGEIVKREFKQIEDRVRKEGKKIVVGKGVVESIVESGYSYTYGARFIKREVLRKIRSPLTELWDKGDVFEIVEMDGEILISVKEKTKNKKHRLVVN